jgi:hypothetical protein
MQNNNGSSPYLLMNLYQMDAPGGLTTNGSNAVLFMILYTGWEEPDRRGKKLTRK